MAAAKVTKKRSARRKHRFVRRSPISNWEWLSIVHSALRGGLDIGNAVDAADVAMNELIERFDAEGEPKRSEWKAARGAR